MSGPERRLALLAVARGLFAERGFHGTSTADIARAAGCSEAVLYRHFASKQALFAAVLEAGASVMQARLEEAAARSVGDPFAGLARALAERVTEPGMPDALKLRSLAVTMADEPEIRATLERIRAGFVQIVGDAVRGSQVTGTIRADVDPEHVMALFAGLSFLGAFTCALGGDAELRRLGPVAASLVHLLRPTPPPSSPEAP